MKTLREKSREICKRQLGMHEYTNEERRIIHKHRKMDSEACKIIMDWKKKLITRQEINKKIQEKPLEYQESFKELLNVHRKNLKKY